MIIHEKVAIQDEKQSIRFKIIEVSYQHSIVAISKV